MLQNKHIDAFEATLKFRTIEDKTEAFKERLDFFNMLMSEYVSDDFRDYLVKNGFFNAPASRKFHGCYAGGLFDHSIVVLQCLLQLTKDNKLTWSDERSPYIIAMFHDLCKIDQYIFDETSNTYTWNKNQSIVGHGSKSVILLSKFYYLTDEERLCIRYHMGAFEDADKVEFCTAIKSCNNVLWTHTADMIASQMFDT